MCNVRASTAHKIFILSAQKIYETPEVPIPEPLEMTEETMAPALDNSIEYPSIIHDLSDKPP